MKQAKPDWLRAGSPLSYKWFTDTSKSLNDVTWVNIGLISDYKHKLSVDIAKDKLGKPVALKIHNSLTHYSEIGWLLKPNDTLQYPVLSPSDWTIHWDYWLSGKLNDEELLNILLKASDPTKTMIQPNLPVAAKAPLKKLVICSLITLILSLLLGLSLNEKSSLNNKISILQDSSIELKDENKELQNENKELSDNVRTLEDKLKLNKQ